MSDPVLDSLRGGWQPQPASAVQGQPSFAASGQAAPNLWRRPLPSDPDQAQAALATAEHEQTALLERVHAIPAEIEQLARGQRRGQVSFAAPERLTEEQRRLLEGLRWLEAAPRRPVSFEAGLPPEPQRLEWAKGWDEFHGLLAQTERLVSNMAWVETELGGLTVARTMVAWSGDAHTEWRAGVSPAQAQVHERELNLALSQRQTLIRVVTLTAQSAARLSVTLTMPGGGLLAIPQVWQYTRRLIELLKTSPKNEG